MRAHAGFTVGLIDVQLTYEGEEQTAPHQMGLLSKCLRGIASGADVEMFIRLLNGSTLDAVLGRPVRPCGCRGKD